ncbi:hypothetical protein QR680_015912 [Steinernema hermaphroditum]|uniref:Uncharacterized protein n=1 Tax=Steinernema hermaphroditum TaxID=289476 RepID=A0AA39LLP8_9BILA|nr:hypothetical protein QR680_015912 [Steinernema hermaphroditum]
MRLAVLLLLLVTLSTSKPAPSLDSDDNHRYQRVEFNDGVPGEYIGGPSLKSCNDKVWITPQTMDYPPN